MRCYHPTCWLLILAAPWSVLSGCAERTERDVKVKPAVVTVALPLEKEMRDFVDFTGQLQAKETVEIRARVTGYLDKVFFKEGDDVQKGEELYQIDPRPYQADLDRAVGAEAQVEARLSRLEGDFRRGQKLVASNAMSREEFDKIAGDRAEAESGIKSAKATVEKAKLDLDFTKISAPISGRISRTYVDPGNLVKADSTLLTMLVSLNPIYVYFDVDEHTLLDVARRRLAGKFKTYKDDKYPVFIGLADEMGYHHEGVIDFADPSLDPGTGTRRIRGVFENKQELLAPGMFVRVRVPIGDAGKKLLVSERSVGTNQGLKFLYVVNDKNMVVERFVKLGPLDKGLRAVEEGLDPKDKVIVTGLQRVRPGVIVDPKLVEMPLLPEARGTTKKE